MAKRIKKQIKIEAISRIYSAIETVPHSKATSRLKLIKKCYLDARKRELLKLYDLFLPEYKSRSKWDPVTVVSKKNAQYKALFEFKNDSRNKLKVKIEIV